MSTVIFTATEGRGRYRVAVTIHCNGCTAHLASGYVDSSVPSSDDGAALAGAERRAEGEGWEIRRGVRSESNPQGCDSHLCPACRMPP
jgi:hypothetical protein